MMDTFHLELEEINSNKFDPKMAFNYKFVDHMKDCPMMVNGKMDFKLAGKTLDAATKIFMSKVDIVHKQTKKISNRFTMNDCDTNKNDRRRGAKKKKINHLKDYTGKNVSKTVNAINGKLPKRSLGDPLYEKLSSAYDVSDISKLMNKQLYLTPSGSFAFNSSDRLSFPYDKHPNDEQLYYFDVKLEPSRIHLFPFPLKKDTDYHTVHPAFRDFDFNDRSVDMERTVDEYIRLLNMKSPVDADDMENSVLIANNVYNFNDDPEEVIKQSMAAAEEPVGSPPEDEARKRIVTDVPDFDMDDLGDDHDVEGIFGELAMQHRKSGRNEGDRMNGMDEGHADEGEAEEGLRKSVDSSVRGKASKSQLAEKASFMANIFNDRDFFDKKFLKRIHSRRFPNDRPKALFDETLDQPNLSVQTPVNVSRASGKKIKPAFNEVSIEFVREPVTASIICKKIMTITTLKNNVNKVINKKVRQRSGYRHEQLYTTFWKKDLVTKGVNPIVLVGNGNHNGHAGGDVTVENDELNEMNFDEDDDDDYVDQSHIETEVVSPGSQMVSPVSQNAAGDVSQKSNSFDQSFVDYSQMSTVSQMSRKRMLSHDSSQMSTCKTPKRYVTDFGYDIDPFGLGEQNRFDRENDDNTGDLIPLEERCLEFSTKMKKINIKKLKKLMFTFVEKFSWKHSKLQAYLKDEARNGPERCDCLSFFKLIYHVIYDGNLDERTIEDLTIPIFFVATLHLCNDKRLQLSKFKNGSGDFYISFLE